MTVKPMLPEQPPLRVLVLCTGNSARSILAEALFNHLGQGRVVACSAGSRPAGKVNPVAVQTLEQHGVPLPADLRSKSWGEFALPGAAAFDFVVTVCGNADNETCPVWPGSPHRFHWGVDDPAHVEPLAARQAAFEAAYQALAARIAAWLALAPEALDPAAACAAAQRIQADLP